MRAHNGRVMLMVPMGVSRMGVWSWRRNLLVVPLPECLAMRAKMCRRVLEKRGFYVAPDLGNQEVEDLAKRVKAANDGLSLAFGKWQKKKKVNVTEICRMRLWILACRFMLDVSELCGLTLNESDVSLDRCLW